MVPTSFLKDLHFVITKFGLKIFGLLDTITLNIKYNWIYFVLQVFQGSGAKN